MSAVNQKVGEVRERRPVIDHVIRMQQHYSGVEAAQHAGAITYFAFLSFFPVLALAFFVVGYVSYVFPGANDALTSSLRSLFPGIVGDGPKELSLRDFRSFSGLAGLVGLAGVLYAGTGWVQALRRALAAVFEVPEDDRLGFVPGKLRDVVVLGLIGATLLVAVAVSGLVSRFSTDLLDLLTLDAELSWLVELITYVIGIAANILLFFTMFRLLGGRLTPTRALVTGAVLGALLFEVLKRLASELISLTEGQPAFQAFGIALVMLVWINYFSRVVLYAASWAHTDPTAREEREQRRREEGQREMETRELAAVQLRETRRRGGRLGIGPGKAFAAGGVSMLGVVALLRRRGSEDP